MAAALARRVSSSWKPSEAIAEHSVPLPSPLKPWTKTSRISLRSPVECHAGTSFLPIPRKNTLWDNVLELEEALLGSGVLLGEEGGDQQVEMVKATLFS